MRCRKPRTVGFQPDGKTIAWSQKNYSKEYPTFQLPCGKCTACRLEYARSWAIRATHEAAIHPQNSFLTLTYSDENLGDNKLHYADFQEFIQKLRDRLRTDQDGKAPEIGYMAVGEYGEKTKRAHWHACLFNYRPDDPKLKYSNELGDPVYKSDFLTDIWGKGFVDYGDVTFKSAGYCARYALKKINDHGEAGYDQNTDFKPIFKTSRKYAIGKRWLEKYWPDVFNYGHVYIRKPDGTTAKTGIPRYYEKWLQKNHFNEYVRYLEQVKYPKIESIEKKNLEAEIKHIETNWDNPYTKSRAETEHHVLTETINKRLQNNLKF